MPGFVTIASVATLYIWPSISLSIVWLSFSAKISFDPLIIRAAHIHVSTLLLQNCTNTTTRTRILHFFDRNLRLHSILPLQSIFLHRMWMTRGLEIFSTWSPCTTFFILDNKILQCSVFLGGACCLGGCVRSSRLDGTALKEYMLLKF